MDVCKVVKHTQKSKILQFSSMLWKGLLEKLIYPCFILVKDEIRWTQSLWNKGHTTLEEITQASSVSSFKSLKNTFCFRIAVS